MDNRLLPRAIHPVELIFGLMVKVAAEVYCFHNVASFFYLFFVTGTGDFYGLQMNCPRPVNPKTNAGCFAL